MTFEKKIDEILEPYNFTEDQKQRFLILANEIANSNIAKEYKVRIIVSVAEHIAKENEQKATITSETTKKV